LIAESASIASRLRRQASLSMLTHSYMLTPASPISLEGEGLRLIESIT
jgi:hypothetical protein